MSSITYVYWVHYPDHSDPSTEGYVGITNDLYHREWRHRNNAGNPIAYNAMKKGAVFSVLAEYNTREEAIAREIELRPTENIGWNIREGGGDPPRMTRELADSPEFRKAVSEGQKARWEQKRAQGWKHKTHECQFCSVEVGATMIKKHERTCYSNPDVYNRLPECEKDGCTNKVTTRPDRNRFCSKKCSAIWRCNERTT